MKVSGYEVVSFHLAALAIRTSDELLKKAGRLDPRSPALFIIILLDMVVLWASWFTMCVLDPVPLALPAVVPWIGLTVLVGGLVLAVGALIQLRGVENIDHLVTTWFFGTVRHLEEQHLETSFGAAYRAYRARTWF